VRGSLAFQDTRNDIVLSNPHRAQSKDIAAVALDMDTVVQCRQSPGMTDDLIKIIQIIRGFEFQTTDVTKDG
jgi:hypothetical protein